MTSGQKTALSLLLSVILFSAFALASFAGLFSAIDARFYEPAKISSIRKRLSDVCFSADEFISALQGRFALDDGAFLKNPSVQTFVESRPDEKAALERSELVGELRSSTPGFLGFRVLDKNQNSIHYSTFAQDVLRRDEKNKLTAYKNYLDLLSPGGAGEISAQKISCLDTDGDLAAGKKIFFDSDGRMVFSFALYDRYSVFRGTALFYVNAKAFEGFLQKKNLISVGEELGFLSASASGSEALFGFVIGLPSVGTEEFNQSVLDAWKSGSDSVQRLFVIDEKTQNYWVCVSARSPQGVFASAVCNDQIFSLSKSARLLILACAFISIFLICFLLLNLRRDDESVIRERIRTLQLGVVDEYLSKKEALDWDVLRGRRDAVTKEIISSLGRRAKKRPRQVEELINRSWDELFAAMNLRPAASASNAFGGLENAQEIKAMLQEILSSGAIKVQAVQPPALNSASSPSTPTAVEEAEEMEEIADAEPVEEAEGLEEVEEIADAEPVEEVEDLEEVEEIADSEPVEEAEDLEEVEEVADAEPVEDQNDNLVHIEEFVRPAASMRDDSELFDISENAGEDFFAVGSSQKRGSLLARAKDIQFDSSLDPYYKAREAFEPNDEAEILVNNFTISGPDYKSLDARSAEQTLNGSLEDDKNELVRDLSLEDFGLKPDEKKEEFTEVLDFSAPKNLDDGDGFDVASTFTTESPRFERSPLAFAAGASFSPFAKKERGDASETKKAQVARQGALAIPLSDSRPFMLSSFASVLAAPPVDLQKVQVEAIERDSNGVFSISDDLDTQGFAQDDSFKSLVDSVLNKA